MTIRHEDLSQGKVPMRDQVVTPANILIPILLLSVMLISNNNRGIQRMAIDSPMVDLTDSHIKTRIPFVIKMRIKLKDKLTVNSSRRISKRHISSSNSKLQDSSRTSCPPASRRWPSQAYQTRKDR